MPLLSDHNLYPGVNAHLNSFLQQPGGGWESFHVRHINDLQAHLDQVLPRGYYALSEKSLQISTYGADADARFQTYSDIAIYRLPTPDPSSAGGTLAPTLSLPMREVLIDLQDEALMSVVIYQVREGRFPGTPITRIELLSPANKPGDSDYRPYLARRLSGLRAGIALVEIDFLHQQRALLPTLPSYPQADAGSAPYSVLISDPRPELMQGKVDAYAIAVDAPLPVLALPLADAETVSLDMGAVYAQTFTSVRVFSQLVDYALDPPAFDKFTPDDQAKIQAILQRIRAESPP